jgi:hypothetical protein
LLLQIWEVQKSLCLPVLESDVVSSTNKEAANVIGTMELIGEVKGKKCNLSR